MALSMETIGTLKERKNMRSFMKERIRANLPQKIRLPTMDQLEAIRTAMVNIVMEGLALHQAVIKKVHHHSCQEAFIPALVEEMEVVLQQLAEEV